MEIKEEKVLVLTLKDESIDTFKEILKRLQKKKIGFGTGSLSEKEQKLLDDLADKLKIKEDG